MQVGKNVYSVISYQLSVISVSVLQCVSAVTVGRDISQEGRPIRRMFPADREGCSPLLAVAVISDQLAVADRNKKSGIRSQKSEVSSSEQ